MEGEVGVCSVCFEEFADEEGQVPRMLNCGHSFCEGCLIQLPSARTTQLECPKCRGKTPLTQGGVKDLPKNFDVIEMIAHLTKHKTKEKKEPKGHVVKDNTYNQQQQTQTKMKEEKDKEGELDYTWLWAAGTVVVGVGAFLAGSLFGGGGSTKDEEQNKKSNNSTRRRDL